MDNEKLVIFEKYPNAVDANIVKGALDASGIPAGVIGDSTANAIWMAPITVVVFRRDLEMAIKVIYDSEANYKDYQDEMTREQFDNMLACNHAFCGIALKCHPELDSETGKQYRDLFAMAKDARDAGDLALLEKIASTL